MFMWEVNTSTRLSSAGTFVMMSTQGVIVRSLSEPHESVLRQSRRNGPSRQCGT